jgi:hypothetical protein
LVERWENQARQRFASAERSEAEVPSITERRALEHDAMILFNCAQALREASRALPSSSASQPPA